ncbi:ribose 5-phosphate isomerase A [Neobacillus cucumis]|uniref:ribose 5-phosphate isomerase A n=1 Tax=Neobacillus cucumis TaxID=1740721 RepID=UPI002E204B6D|nr:ribose 5-phosphate isomerase A [Neobacillus cucumis]
MDANELRKLCAKEAMKYIHHDFIIGLGAGRNIECLIELLDEEIKNGLKVKVVTPSYDTKRRCVEKGIEVLETYFVDEVDVAFDGCGEVDKNFYASKSGGGVHTKEKLIAAMAKEYILLIDEEKYSDTLSCKYPIALEVIKDSLSYVIKNVKKIGGEPTVRRSSIKDGYTITDDGNFLIEVQFQSINDFKELNDHLNNIDGVIGTGLFTKEVTKLIIAVKNDVRVISKVESPMV